jgi:predicted DNA-binding protein (MmcQ/YjbR family)
MRKKTSDPVDALRVRALTFPGAWEDHPWGDTCVKVNKKIFAFFGEDKLTLKLVEAHEAAMSLPGAQPTAYGMGKAGWVTLPLGAQSPPLEILYDWLEESYRLIAPKKLAAQLDERGRA